MLEQFSVHVKVGDLLKLKEIVMDPKKDHRFFLVLESTLTSWKLFDMTENTVRSYGTSIFSALIQHQLDGAWRDGAPITIIGK